MVVTRRDSLGRDVYDITDTINRAGVLKAEMLYMDGGNALIQYIVPLTVPRKSFDGKIRHYALHEETTRQGDFEGACIRDCDYILISKKEYAAYSKGLF